MQLFKHKKDLLFSLKTERKNKIIGFVPTMGALHSGHLSLIEAAKKSCDIAICSIFVNPTQFNSETDFKKYPKTLKEDICMLKKVGCDIVYTPKVNDLYDLKEKAKEFDFSGIENTMEGKFRPGHFNGMATVIKKFFSILTPEKAFFGEKDLQQLEIVKILVKQLNLKTEIIGVPTVREKNGLAKSSRNKLLSEKKKNEAAIIYECLKYSLENKSQGVIKLKSHIKKIFDKKASVDLEYVEFVSIKTMQPIFEWEGDKENAICIAAHIDGVRLIDNIIL